MVLDDADAALDVATRGRCVVLIVAESSVVTLDLPPGSGRIATFVGDADDPRVRSAAEEMDRELFGVGA